MAFNCFALSLLQKNMGGGRGVWGGAGWAGAGRVPGQEAGGRQPQEPGQQGETVQGNRFSSLRTFSPAPNTQEGVNTG